jgi:EmrB/QacA subfamily drug resistance transporter
VVSDSTRALQVSPPSTRTAVSNSPHIESEHGHPGIVLATLATANVMALLDMFVVNVALHDIGVSLHYQSSLSDVAWVLNAYALFFGALLIPAGRFADKYGRKATFMAGLAVFTVASVACAISPNLWVLVGFRSVQAIGAAMLIPSSLGLVLTTIPPDRVKRGVRLWTVTGAAAGSLGPVVGGLLTSLSWRWIFAINLPIGIAAVLVTWKMIPNVRHDRSARIPDLFGSLMIVVTIGAVSLGLLNGAGWGWGSGKIIASWITAAAAALAFVISTRRAAVPVIDPRIFQSRVFTAANVAIVIAATIFGMQLLGLSLFLQQSWHWPVITTGLAIAPGPAAVVGSSFIAQRFNQRFPVGAVVAFGFAMIAAGQVLMLLTLRHGIHNYAGAILPGWILIGIGFGFTMPTIIGSAAHDLPPQLSATGSAVVNSGRQIGGVFGASILVVILGRSEVTGDPGRFYDLWWAAAALCAAAALVSLALTPKRHPANRAAGVPAASAAVPAAGTIDGSAG